MTRREVVEAVRSPSERGHKKALGPSLVTGTSTGGQPQPKAEHRPTQPPGTQAVQQLNLKPLDEEHRLQAAPKSPGYCVDELCACDHHDCAHPDECVKIEGYTADGYPMGVDKAAYEAYLTAHGIPLRGGGLPASLYYKKYADSRDFVTENRSQYTAKGVPMSGQGVDLLYGPDGVPLGIDPAVWHEYVAKHGVPPKGQIPAHLFYKHFKDTRDFVTEQRAAYTPKGPGAAEDAGRFDAMYGPDGVPLGVSPKAWRDYIQKHGIPPKGQIPASLFYRSYRENRDFTTEARDQYTPKRFDETAGAGHGVAYGPDGVPVGVDPQAWKDYVAKHGLPPKGQVPAHLYYRHYKDTRDFVTEQRANFCPKEAERAGDGVTYGPDGVPFGVDPEVWKNYVAEHGVPPKGQIPAHLYYRHYKDNRDFLTEHRREYQPKVAAGGFAQNALLFGPDGIPVGIDKDMWSRFLKEKGMCPPGFVPASLLKGGDARDCQVSELPPYTMPQKPLEHTFWDPVAKRWY